MERVLVQRDLRRPPVEMLRVTRRGYFIADCRSVDEVAAYVDLAALVAEQP